jgi:predicted methyltransferase
MIARPALAMVLATIAVVVVPRGAPAQAPRAQATPPKDRLFPPLSLGLLEAPDRAEWTKPDLIMDALSIADGSLVADLGAGGGWFSAQLSRRVGPNGVVYAEDIQSLMIEATTLRVQNEGLNNIRTILGTATDPRLPPDLDAVLIVDAYHEIDEPTHPGGVVTLLTNVAGSLKPQGRLGVVDFLPGGGGPGPASEDRVNPESVIKAAEAAGLKLQSREVIPPFQFLLVFGKANAAPRRTP